MSKQREHSHSTDTISITSYIFLFISLCFLPYHIYNIFAFFSNRRSVAILRRYPIYIVIYDLLLILFGYVFAPYQILFETLEIAHTSKGISSLLYSSCAFGVSWVFFIRAFLLYFDYGYHSALSNSTWAIDIVGKSSFKNRNWFLTHSNFKDRIFYYVLPIWIVSVVIYTYLAFEIFDVHSSGLFGMNILLLSIPWILTIFIWYKMRFYDVQDFFAIREELILGAFVTFISVTLFIIAHVGYKYVWRTNKKKHTSERIDSLLLFIICSIWAQLILYTSTTRVLKRNSKYLPLQLTKSQQREALEKQKKLGALVPNSNGNTKNNGKLFYNKTASKMIIKSTFEDYISHKRGFHLFVTHLIKEFSVENLLFIVELHQWKSYLRKKKINRKLFKSYNLRKPLKFPSIVPETTVIKNETNPMSQAKLLFDKYCNPKTAGQQLINLRGGTLKRLKKIFESDEKVVNNDIIDIYCLFNDAEENIMKLLRGSWSRFQTSAAYVEESNNTSNKNNKSNNNIEKSKTVNSTKYLSSLNRSNANKINSDIIDVPRPQPETSLNPNKLSININNKVEVSNTNLELIGASSINEIDKSVKSRTEINNSVAVIVNDYSNNLNNDGLFTPVDDDEKIEKNIHLRAPTDLQEQQKDLSNNNSNGLLKIVEEDNSINNNNNNNIDDIDLTDNVRDHRITTITTPKIKSMDTPVQSPVLSQIYSNSLDDNQLYLETNKSEELDKRGSQIASIPFPESYRESTKL